MPKNQTTDAKKARAAARTGAKYTANLRAAQTCGKQLDPWGEFPDTCARPHHADGEQCSKDRNFDQAAWQKRIAAEWAAEEARWNALTPEQQAEAKRLQWESEYDDGRTASDDWEDARAYKWED